MPELASDNRHWKELGFGEKLKFTIAGSLVTSSIALGFISFIILLEIPTSVIGLSGLWLSTALAILGIASYFNNEMIKFQSDVQDRLQRLHKKHIDDNDELLDS